MKLLKMSIFPAVVLLSGFVLPFRALAGDEASAERGAKLFDGGTNRPVLSGLPTAGADPAIAAEKERLLDELGKNVAIDDRGNKAEGTKLRELLGKVLDTNEGRALAAQFINEKGKATLSFEEIPGTVIVDIGGRREFNASGGHAHVSMEVPEVHMNAAYMVADREGAETTLAHELFGHVLQTYRARRFAVTDAWNSWREEEANAGLTGWLVGAELGLRQDNAWQWIYMANPDDYHARLKTMFPYYSQTLSREEMSDPVAAYRKRLESVEKLIAEFPARRANQERWRRIISHLEEKHGAAPDSFTTIRKSIQGIIDTLPATLKNLEDIKATLSGRISFLSGLEGQRYAARMREQIDSPYFKEQEADMERKRQALAGYMAGTTQAAQTKPWPPGQVTWPELTAAWEAHKKEGCGWAP
jgi:hypothetical protein